MREAGMTARASLTSLVAIVLLSGLLAGCAAPPPVDVNLRPGSSPSASAASDSSNPAGLVGLWRVTGGIGQRGDVWLRLSTDGMMVFADCGRSEGGWIAAEGKFVADAYGRSEACGDSVIGSWLRTASGYTPAAGGYALIDDVGNAVARLSRAAGVPASTDKHADEYSHPLRVSSEVEEQFAPPVPLPRGALATELTGRWAPAKTGTRPGYIEFNADHVWTGSDGCNGTGGRWLSVSDGLFAASTGLTTLVFCEDTADIGFMAEARRVGMIGEKLTFFDAAGQTLGSMVREGQSR